MIHRLETDHRSVARSRRCNPRRVTLAAIAALTFGVSACDSAREDPADTTPGDTSIDAPIFDPSVEDGVDTETDEGRNSGFEADEPSGNVTDVND